MFLWLRYKLVKWGAGNEAKVPPPFQCQNRNLDMDLESETFYMMCVCGIGYESPAQDMKCVRYGMRH